MLETERPETSSALGRGRARLRIAAWAAGAPLMLLFLVPGGLGVPPSWRLPVSRTAFLVPYALAVAGCLASAVRARESERRFWTLLGVATGLVFANEAYVAWLQARLGGELAWTAPTVVLTLGGATAFVALLISMTRLRVPAGVTRFRYAVDALLAAGLAFVVTLSVLITPLYAPFSDVPRLERLLAAAYPVIAVVVFGGTLTNLVGLKASRWTPWERIAAAGIGVFAVGLAAWPLWYLSAVRVGGPLAPGVEAMWAFGHHLLFVAAVYRLTSAEERWDIRPLPPVRLPVGSWTASAVLGAAFLASALSIHQAHVSASPVLTRLESATIVGSLAVLLVARTALITGENRALHGIAALDAVTGLPNHRSFHEVLATELAVAGRYGEQLSLAILDIDLFGHLNDLLGHPAGDAVLEETGRALTSVAPRRSTVARIGGDEFAVVMPETGPAAATEACESMRAALAGMRGRAVPPVRASFGVASFPAHASGKDELIRFADGAQYWAKLHGRDRVVAYDPEVIAVLDAEERIRLLQEEHVLDTMQSLAAAVDARDPGTRFHSRTVASLAVRLAEDIGLAPETVRLLEAAAILHDVGKIGISDAVLRKPGPLDAEERRHVREHPVLAQRILSGTSLGEIVPWVIAHHERWDGEGYPSGAAGEDIPLEARILAICDAYDAMVSDRPYRSALSAEAALQEIDLNMGTQFDPHLAERFIRLVQEDGWGRAAGA
ncbi:MAG: diguanylate cyclase [Coriobacteriia bacterium]|nr:diguanylate cyclase [Coriobacteriia bacterium]